MHKSGAALAVEQIIASICDNAVEKYRSAAWLSCDFDNEVWTIDAFHKITIDWRIALEDGTLLTAPEHRELWTSLRSWLIAQTHPDFTGGQHLSSRSQINNIYRCLHCIDFLLPRSKQFSLATHGLLNLTSNDIKGALLTICSSSRISTTVYEWPERLADYLRRAIVNLSPVDNLSSSKLEPLSTDYEPLLNLSQGEAALARHWLALNDLYKKKTFDHRRIPSNRKLAALIYPNTIWATSALLPTAPELSLYLGDRYTREFDRAPVTLRGDSRMSTRAAAGYGATLRSLRLLSLAGIDGPTFDTTVIDSSLKNLDLKANRRFRSLPYSSVMTALRKAIEYFIEEGEALVHAYLTVCERASSSSLTASQAFMSIKLENTEAAETLQRFDDWSLRKIQDKRHEYFVKYRSSPGLRERLVILVGSIRLALGALTARRNMELSSLRAGSTLDTSRTRIVFHNGKSGVADWRERIARPIPPIASRMIHLLERLHKGMITCGFAEEHMRLLSTPCENGQPRLTFSSGGCLDAFCDWAGTDRDNLGRRYYIRHHQLRRFFATVFFYGGGFGGLDTLRWFLGHVDAQHVWHYITENVPGAAIRSVAAEFATYQIKHKTEEGEKLHELLTREFGVADFATLDDEALTDYVHSLIDDSSISVEPQFLDSGRSYRIAILVSDSAR